jgi:hypothetical protein
VLLVPEHEIFQPSAESNPFQGHSAVLLVSHVFTIYSSFKHRPIITTWKATVFWGFLIGTVKNPVVKWGWIHNIFWCNASISNQFFGLFLLSDSRNHILEEITYCLPSSFPFFPFPFPFFLLELLLGIKRETIWQHLIRKIHRLNE